MKIITNHQFRDVIYGYDLSASEREQFDYYADDDLDMQGFIRYKGELYDLREFMPTPQDEPVRQELNDLAEWDGYQSDSFFSGIVIQYSDDFERVKIGTYIA